MEEKSDKKRKETGDVLTNNVGNCLSQAESPAECVKKKKKVIVRRKKVKTLETVKEPAPFANPDEINHLITNIDDLVLKNEGLEVQPEEQGETAVEDNIISFSHLFANHKISHRNMFKFTSSDRVFQKHEYPLSWDKPCMTCREKFEGMPFFQILKLDEKTGVWTFLQIGYCHPICVVDQTFIEKRYTSLELLTRFLRQFCGFPCRPLTYVPQSTLSVFSDTPGFTQKERKESMGKFAVVEKIPPSLFVNVCIEQKDLNGSGLSQNDIKKIQVATEEQQRAYKINLERVTNRKIQIS